MKVSQGAQIKSNYYEHKKSTDRESGRRHEEVHQESKERRKEKEYIDRETDGRFFNAQCTMTVISRRKVDCNQKRNEKQNKNKKQWDKNPEQTHRDRDETDRDRLTD